MHSIYSVQVLLQGHSSETKILPCTQDMFDIGNSTPYHASSLSCLTPPSISQTNSLHIITSEHTPSLFLPPLAHHVVTIPAAVWVKP